MTDLRQLAREVEELRDDLAYLTTLVEPNFTAAAAAGVATAVPAKSDTRAHVWDNLTGAEAGRAWTALTGWVDWLTDRYGLDDTLPDCWYRHGAIVDELDASRASWTAAYLNPNAAAGDAATWLESLTATMGRIREWDRYGCAAGTHRDNPPAARGCVAHEDRVEFLQNDIETRTRRHALSPASADEAKQDGRDGRGDVRGDTRGDAEPLS